MPSPSRRLTTLWFADIAGFTRLSATDEPLALKAMDVMRRCVRAAVSGKQGKVIKYLGDGALAEFPSSEGAVEAALEAGAMFMAGTRTFAGGPYRLHFGIHVGDVTVSDGDIFGDGVNRAARLQSLGEPGEVLVSEEVYALVRRRPELRFISQGERTVKGLDEPFLVYTVEPSGELAARLELIRSGVVGSPKARDRRPIAVGIFAGVLAFGGLAVWTAMGGQAAIADESAPVPIPALLPLPASNEAFAMPAWPPPTARPAALTAPRTSERVANMIEEATPALIRTAAIIAPPAPPPNSLAGLALLGEQYLARLGRDLNEHEVLPLLRRALNEARDGGPTGPRAEAIRAITLFVVARAPEQAEAAFRASLADDASSGITRVMYAELLMAHGRFSEARFQLEKAKGKGVANGMLEGARGRLLFREGSYGDARTALERSLKDDEVLSTRVLLARALIAQGETDDALRVLDRAIGSFEVVPWMALARIRGGAVGANRQGMIDMASRDDAGYAGALLLLEAAEPMRALERLERLVDQKDPDVIWLAVDPEWAPLRNDLRFRALVERALGRR